ncbi:MAG: hypothetical protein PHI44_00325 [Candidatus Ratteibacteria bacterium]|nr:hypothetical protein [Candidatus Ratteibacteria bacterium]
MEKDKINNKNKRKQSPLRHIKFVLAFYTITLLLLSFIYWICPKYYKANASILQPPERELKIETGSSEISEKMSSQLRTNTELFFSVLNSRSMKDAIIEKYNLVEAYNVSNIDRAREKLDKLTKISLTKEKVIEITVVDRNPKRAAEIANFFIQRLDETIKEISITTAKQDRIFIEGRLKETESSIKDLEEKLAGIKNREKLVADKELVQVTQMAGKLMEELVNKKLELQKKSEVLQSSNIEIVLLKKEIQDIETTLSRLLYSEDELTGMLRELKTQEEVYKFLTTKLEEAKINEARDTPVVQVLDYAVVPHKIYRPDIKVLLIVQGLVSGVIAVLVFFMDLLRYLGSI